MVQWIFDFEYTWEVYKPARDRKYGYYVLPVIYGDRFVARFDPAFDKKTRQLTITNWWWEDGVESDDKLQSALSACFRDFMHYLDCEQIFMGEKIKKDKTLQWVKELGD